MAIPATTATTVLDTDIPDSEMTTMVSRVDADGARRIMTMLVDMYADPATAVVREYVANAVDSSILSGTDEPVRITSPTPLTPNLVVADRGTGMSAAEVEAHFLAFAASTKRNTNDQVGELGVGAKSAWTMCASFVIDTVKDGKRTVVRASRDLEHNVLMADSPSDLPNGTSITIPVNMDSASWSSVIHQVASAHRQGTVFVDGDPVASMHGGNSWIGPMRAGLPAGVSSGLFVTAGGTLFGLPNELRRKISETAQMDSGVLSLPVGSFDHTPSRESLIATDRTKAAVMTALRAFEKARETLHKKIVKLASTDIRAAVALRAEILHGSGAQSSVLSIPFRVSFPDLAVLVRGYSSSRRTTYVWRYNTKSLEHNVTQMQSFLDTVFVVTDTPSTSMPRGLTKYMSATQYGMRSVVVLPQGVQSLDLPIVTTGEDDNDEPTGQVWTIGRDHPNHVSYADLRAKVTELTAADRENRQARTYPCMEIASDGERSRSPLSLADVREVLDENPSLTVLYHTGLYSVSSELRDALVINIDKYSKNPVVKAIPEAESLSEWTERYLETRMANVTDDELDAMVAGSDKYDALLRVVHQARQHIDESHSFFGTLDTMASLWERSRDTDIQKLREEVFSSPFAAFSDAHQRVDALYHQVIDAYPLVRHVGRWGGYPSDAEHSVQYLAHTPPRVVEKD